MTRTGDADTASVQRLKRNRIRSWRRGTKEMDLILGPYADGALADLAAADLDAYESLLNENDQDLYRWYSRQAEAPERHARALDLIRSYHGF